MPGGDGTGPTGAGPGTGSGGGSCGYKFNIPLFAGKKVNTQNNRLLSNLNKPIFNVGAKKDEFVRIKR